MDKIFDMDMNMDGHEHSTHERGEQKSYHLNLILALRTYLKNINIWFDGLIGGQEK